MFDQGIKSRPVYDRLRIDPSGLRHLLVLDSPAFPIAPLLAEAGDLEVWSVAPRTSEGVSREGASSGGRSFRSLRQLFDSLDRRLPEERMGFRLYAAGQEGFLWDIYGAAQRAGMGKQEVFLSHFGSQRRRVLCVHCRTFNEGVATTIVPCAGCGARLFVRDHFSRRQSAFMGVKIDAERPGDVPPAQEAYP